MAEPRPPLPIDTLRATPVSPDADTPEAGVPVPLFVHRYVRSGVLGAGGMGEVHLARDLAIGREIAVKEIRGEANALDVRRFVREARVQGQLEHPAIVPVYDLAMHDERPFFTMKRIHGRSWDAIFAGDAVSSREMITRRKMLTSFSQICLALDFAHARGVVHRDVKPQNLMLGDFGEVYLLDWGIAKIGQVTLAEAKPIAPGQEGAATAAGGMVGTPGYMSPEAVRGEPVDLRTDVYALGCVLYEMLTGRPLHEGTTVKDLLASTAAGADARFTMRFPDLDLPPELETICVRATASRPEDRYSSAREISDAIERFLDGDRDLVLRGQLARTHVERAMAEARRAEEEGDASAGASAMREIGQALALDPRSAAARRVLVGLLTASLPATPEVEQKIEREVVRAQRIAGRIGGVGFLAMATTLPILLLMGVRDALLFAAWAIFIFGGVALSFGQAFVGGGKNWYRGVLAVGVLLVAASTRLFGPLLSAPTLALAIGIALVVHPRRTSPLTVAGLLTSAVLVPFALEVSGALEPSYVFERDSLVIVPHLASLPHTATLAYMLAATIGVVFSVLLYVGRVAETLREAQVRLVQSAAQLRHLLPPDAPVFTGRAPRVSSRNLAD